MAIRLSKAFNTTPQLWLNMQQSHDLWHAQKETDVSRVKILRAAG
jgi:addiction module HigA family antidote